jgi:GxxExxY protein
MKHQELTDAVICCFYTVYNTLGYGFLEKVYENAMMIEMEKRGLKGRTQQPISVRYDGKIVGEYFADILVEDVLIIEIKATTNIIPEHEAQLLNYLRATGKEVGILLNFGPSPQIKRRVYEHVV